MQLNVIWLENPRCFEETLQRQEELRQAVQTGKQNNTLLLLEHKPVYTIGKTSDTSSLKNKNSLPHPTFTINRGGQATYHGPGQLVVYPIINLKPLGKDLHTYLRAIELSLIKTCQFYQIKATQKTGSTGIWIGDQKLASIGIGVKQWVSMHGVAINITSQSLSGFQAITPCGIDGVQMTCLENHSQIPIGLKGFGDQFECSLIRQLEQLEINNK